MWSASQGRAQPSTEYRGTQLPAGAINCTAIHVARALWPRKTAAHWAAAAGVKERMAKYWLAGTHQVSADGKIALAKQILE
jgi:hypothetical protein